MSKTSKSDVQRRRQANAALYAPRRPTVRLAVPAVRSKEDPRLRRLLVETLDALKRPDAVPSIIIQSALSQAAAMK